MFSVKAKICCHVSCVNVHEKPNFIWRQNTYEKSPPQKKKKKKKPRPL